VRERKARNGTTPARYALVLFVALAGVAVSGPLVRLSTAPALTIAVWRVGLSLVIVALMLAVTGQWRQWRRLEGRALAVAVLAGVSLAFHFWSWNASIALTTVAASVVLVNTQPIVVAILSVLWLREPPTRKQWLGIAIAMAGALIVAAPDLAASSHPAGRNPLLGDILALVGAITAGIYYVIGRRLRATLDVWSYVALVYSACFLTLVLLALAVRAPIGGQPRREVEIFLVLAIGPMLLGHTALNWALEFLPAYVVNLVLLGEPVGATLIAAFLPGIREVPPVATFAGGILVLAGVLMAARATRSVVESS
jgi:drug/metabolite transporter (DMT)-like permease